MNVEITPEPDQETRRAILAALAEDESERPERSARAERLLPGRDGDDPADP
ncbi:MAG: hypothetical protein ACRDLV_14755 [Solirubrobacteraceae bacterium]